MYLLGLDIGSSSVKLSIVEAETRKELAFIRHPKQDFDIEAAQPGWAEQNPLDWWDAVCNGITEIIQVSGIRADQIISIGIAYQMHGLVLLDKNHKLLRKAIIWCDSRAVETGEKMLDTLGKDYCEERLLNHPSNFTAARLLWVKEKEPDIFGKIHKILLPGDYISICLTGEISTTVSGLSEAILWDFKNNCLAESVLRKYDISPDIIPKCKGNFEVFGKLSTKAARQTGLKKGTAIAYRCGDQSNNALALGVHKATQTAASGGTSGVVYTLSENKKAYPDSLINVFAHPQTPACSDMLAAHLLCINGTGILYSWMKKNMASHLDYDAMEEHIQKISPGSEGLCIYPFGNGAERMLGNINPGSLISRFQFNKHTAAHFYRASLEGIVCAFKYGMDLMLESGASISCIHAANDNLFQSTVFSETMATLCDVPIKLYDTNGARGAALMSGLAIGLYTNIEDVFSNIKALRHYQPNEDYAAMSGVFEIWKEGLTSMTKL